MKESTNYKFKFEIPSEKLKKKMKKYRFILKFSIIYSSVTFLLTIALMSYHSEFDLKEDDSKRNFIVKNNDNQVKQNSQNSSRLYEECNYLSELTSKLSLKKIICFFPWQYYL
jgi:hypothetical protein